MAKLGKTPTKRRGRAPKNLVIGKMEAMLSHGNGFLLADNKGMTVDAITKMRAKMRANRVEVKVAKNRLLGLALERKGYDRKAIEKLLKGPSVLFVGIDDPITPAKLLIEAAKGSEEKLVVKGGFFEGKALDAKQVEMLSKMASREELLARLVGSINAPATKLVYALNQAAGKVVYAVDAYKRKLEGAA